MTRGEAIGVQLAAFIAKKAMRRMVRDGKEKEVRRGGRERVCVEVVREVRGVTQAVTTSHS